MNKSESVQSFREINPVVVELKELRLKKGLSQRELAKMAGTSQVILSKIETGVVNPTIKMLSSIAQSLGKKIKV